MLKIPSAFLLKCINFSSLLRVPMTSYHRL